MDLDAAQARDLQARDLQASDLGPGQEHADEFFISTATSLQERRPRTLKQGDTFALFDQNGDALQGPDNPEGLYHADTRYLSHLLLTIAGSRPLLLSSTMRDDNVTLTCDLTNPEIKDASSNGTLHHDVIHIRRSRFLWHSACYERIAVRNFDREAHNVRIEVSFAADFADLFEVRGTPRKKRGTVETPVTGKDRVRLAYMGLDGLRRETNLRFDPAPKRLSPRQAVFEMALAPQETQTVFVEIACGASAEGDRPPRVVFLKALRNARRSMHSASREAAAVATSNDIFNEGARRAVADLYTLVTRTPEGMYPYAGIPWYSTVFGRDGIITAFETLWIDPRIAKGVLRFLADAQAKTADPSADAEPGKILHEMRRGEMAELGEVPFRRYYGSIDSTPLFLMLAGAYLKRTDDTALLKALWPNIEAALDWIDASGDRDGDGFIEYGRRREDGLVNQGWKDSFDSIFHKDGTMAHGPIALAEVQAYVYGAWQAGARIAERLDHADRAHALTARAEALRKQFDAAFFDEELGTYVLALDGDKKPCRVRASNAGHALFTGIAYPERAPAVVATLMRNSSFSGWGIRTIATTEARYNPMSYHNGSVWPHDNAMIAGGFARYGFKAETARIFEGLFAASTYIDMRRLPELFCGFTKQRSRGPTFYPVACSPQAWAAVAPLSLIRSCLGLDFDPVAGRISFEEPCLPEFLDEVVLRGLSLGKGQADVAVRRVGAEVTTTVLARHGGIRIQTIS